MRKQPLPLERVKFIGSKVRNQGLKIRVSISEIRSDLLQPRDLITGVAVGREAEGK
jgi:hypothetical protein